MQHACCAQKHNPAARLSVNQTDRAMLQGTLVGSKVYLFGGEDAARRPQGDLFVLDLADMEWQSPEVTGEYCKKKDIRRQSYDYNNLEHAVATRAEQLTGAPDL